MSPQLDGIASTISGGSNGGANAGGQSAAYVLAALPVDPRSRRAALAVGLVSLALFLAIAPFAKQPLPQFPAVHHHYPDGADP